MKKKRLFLLILPAAAISFALSWFLIHQPDPLYYQRENFYEITQSGQILLLEKAQPYTTRSDFTVHDGTVYSLIWDSRTWSIWADSNLLYEEPLIFPENDIADRPEQAPLGFTVSLGYADYGNGGMLFYPFYTLTDEDTHLFAISTETGNYTAMIDFSIDNAMVRSYKNRIYLLIPQGQGRYPARLEWKPGTTPQAVSLSDISVNMNPKYWVAKDRFWWLHYAKDSNATFLCYVPLSGGETMSTELPAMCIPHYISDDYLYYNQNGMLHIYNFRTKETSAHPEFSNHPEVLAAT